MAYWLDRFKSLCWSELVMWGLGYQTTWETFGFNGSAYCQRCDIEDVYCRKCIKTGRLKEKK